VAVAERPAVRPTAQSGGVVLPSIQSAPACVVCTVGGLCIDGWVWRIGRATIEEKRRKGAIKAGGRKGGSPSSAPRRPLECHSCPQTAPDGWEVGPHLSECEKTWLRRKKSWPCKEAGILIWCEDAGLRSAWAALPEPGDAGKRREGPGSRDSKTAGRKGAQTRTVRARLGWVRFFR
jgi:hypothetical protein